MFEHPDLKGKNTRTLGPGDAKRPIGRLPSLLDPLRVGEGGGQGLYFFSHTMSVSFGTRRSFDEVTGLSSTRRLRRARQPRCR